MPIFVDVDERPPAKVMQTAVVGQNGTLTYRLNLDGFPGFGWAFSYFAEIEDLSLNETRKFKLVLPGQEYVQYSKVIVNVQENAQGKYRLYEPGYTNLSLPFVMPFTFKKTNDSSRGPILNAMEICKYLQINYGSEDATLMDNFASYYSSADWAQEGGDPCLPASWSWVQCSSDQQPMIVSINLSGKNLTGNIPSELTKLTGLMAGRKLTHWPHTQFFCMHKSEENPSREQPVDRYIAFVFDGPTKFKRTVFAEQYVVWNSAARSSQ